MSFEAPQSVLNISDIAAIYNMNDNVETEIDSALETMENDIFIETANEEKIKRFESIIGISPLDTETLDDRRYKIKARCNEQLPYSYRILVKKLNNLCGEDGYTLTIDNDSVTVKIELTQKSMFETTKQLLEDTVPLNMKLDVDYMYNQYVTLGAFSYDYLENYTYDKCRNEVMK